MNLRYPERLLQPWKNLRQFTQELYAMFKDAEDDDVSGGIDVEAPPVKIGERTFKVQRKPGGELNLVPEAPEAPARPAPAEGPKRFTPPARRSREPEGRVRAEPIVEERRAAAAERPRLPEPARARREAPSFAEPEPARTLSQPDAAPAFRPRPAEIDLEPRKREVPEITPPGGNNRVVAEEPGRPRPEPASFEGRFDDATRKPKARGVVNVGTNVDYPTPPTPSAGGTAGTTTFIGKVSAFLAPNATVTLYPDGPHGDPGDSVTVNIPTIASDETMDAGTWLFGIFQFTDSNGVNTYFAQPPVWMA